MHGYNYHRELRFGEDQIVLVWMALLGTAAASIEWKSGKKGPWLWICFYGWAICLIVWGIMGLHYVLGDQIPPILINWLPYRLPNHLPPLLVVMMAGIILKPNPAYTRDLFLLGPLIAVAFGMNGSYAFLLLGGATTYFVVQCFHGRRIPSTIWLTLTGMGCLLLWLAFGAYAYWWFGGFVLALGVVRCETRASMPEVPWHWGKGVACACGFVLLVLLWQQWQERDKVVERLKKTPFEEKVAAYVSEHASRDTMLIIPMQLWDMQERLGYPVITEAASLSWIPYRKTIGPALWKIYRDVYKIDITDATPMGSWLAVYRQAWTKRTSAEWARIGAEYNSKYVIAPDFFDLQLPLILEGNLLRLYEIPPAETETPATETETRAHPYAGPQKTQTN